MANELQARPDRQAIQSRRPDLDPGYAANRHHTVFDGSRLSQFIRHNYKLFLAIVLVTVAAMALFTLTRTKVYATKATVMLEQRKQQVVQGLDEVVSNLPSDSSVVDTEVQLLSSAGMAYRVAQATGKVPKVDLQQLGPADQEEVAETVRDILDQRAVQRVGLTYIIDIYYNSSDPSEAQAMANAYAQSYIGSQIEVRREANERARAHLEQEIAKLQVEVKTADAAVARYKAANSLTDTSMGGTLTEQEISSYNQALAAALAQSAEDARRLSAARAQLRQGADSLGDAASPGLLQLRGQQSAISTHVTELESRYGPNHPELVAARQQLADIQRRIEQQSDRSVASYDTQAQASAGRAGAIAGRLSATEGALKRAGTAAVGLRELQMRLDAPQKLLEAYQSRLAQISTQSGSEQPDARVVSFASYPLQPSSPSWFVNLALGLGLGLVLGLLAVLLRQVFSVGVGTSEEVELTFGVDFLAALPSLKNSDDLAIIDKVVAEPNSPFAEALRALAAGVLFTGGDTPRVIGITSASAEEGKTTTSLALGRVLAQRGRRVLVIDCDMQRRAFYQRFGIGSEVGLIDVLRNTALLNQAIVGDTATPAHFLAFGREMEPGLSIDETAMAGLLETLRSHYDVVLLDLPPVLQVAEARVLAALVDTNVLLARWKRTSKQSIDAALATLMRANASISGVALTQVPASSELLLGTYGTAMPRLNAAR